jgi:hypothetical protein
MPENSEIVGQVGFGTIGFNPNDEIILVHQTFWPDSLSNKKDSKGSNFGSKTVFLEAIGMIAPLLLIPDSVRESHVILGVDNIACYYGWVNKSVSGDTCASIVFRALGLLSAYLSVYVHVVHVPRMSTWEARICDRLSRSATTTVNDKRLLNDFKRKKLPKEMLDWLKNPTEDWKMCNVLLNCVKDIIKMK